MEDGKVNEVIPQLTEISPLPDDAELTEDLLQRYEAILTTLRREPTLDSRLIAH